MIKKTWSLKECLCINDNNPIGMGFNKYEVGKSLSSLIFNFDFANRNIEISTIKKIKIGKVTKNKCNRECRNKLSLTTDGAMLSAHP